MGRVVMLEGWRELYSMCPECVYPKYNIRMGNFNRYGFNEVRIMLETFVESKDGKWLACVRDGFSKRGQYEPEFLAQSLERFSNKCYLTQNNYIYNEQTAIER